MFFFTFGSGKAYALQGAGQQLHLNKRLLYFCMRVSMIWTICMIVCLQMWARNSHAQSLGEVSISLNLDHETIIQAFRKIEKSTPFRFAYKKASISTARRLSMDVRMKPVDEILDLLFDGTGLKYEQSDYSIIVTDTATVHRERLIEKAMNADTSIIVRGKIMSDENTPLAGAVIRVTGTSYGTASGTNGNFEIRDVPLNSTLAISFVGYTSQELKVNGSTNYFLVKMEKAQNTLDAVTVVSTGYQSLPKERSTGSFSVITAKELEKIPTANLIQRIEGLVTGLQPKIMAGDNSFLYQNLTQGINSDTRTVGNNDYDLNVRGNTTVLGEKMPLIVVDGFPTNFDLKTLNPADIEQITVLKDAAAASIWGARAANGVIVIDTKKGKSRTTPSINFSASYTTFGSPRFDYLPLANSAQIINYEEEVINKNLNLYSPFSPNPSLQLYKSDASTLVYRLRAGQIDSATYRSEIAKLSSINGYDQYQRYLLQNASAQNYNLSVSGGNESHTYFLGASYSREIPSAVGNNGDRFTLTANQSFKLLKKATLELGLRASAFNYNYNGIGLSRIGSGTNTFLPYNQVFDENGNKVYYSYNYFKGRTDTLQSKYGYQNWGYNYLDESQSTQRSIKDNNFAGNISLNVPIIAGLSASGQFMMEKAYQDTRTWNGPESYYTRDIVNTATALNYAARTISYGIPRGGILSQSRGDNTNYSARGQLIYNAVLGSIHQLNAVAGTEIRQTKAGQTIDPVIYGYNMQTGIGQPVLANYVNVNGTAVTAFSISSTGQQNKTRRFLSYYANAAYTLMDKYSLSGSVRYDDYNNFGVDRKYRATPLWSAGAKWAMHKEKFLENVSWLNSLALRATYGYNGNIAQGIYPFTNISIGTNFTTGLPSASIISPANPTLRWEKTGVVNIGLDYAILNNRLSGTFEWYSKKGRDLLYAFPVDPTYGVSTMIANNTKVDAKGFEASLSGVLVTSKSINWTATFNFSYNKNKIVDTRFIPTSSTYSALSGTNIAGYPTNAVWVYRYAGLDNTGMTQVYDADKQTKIPPSRNPTGIDALYYAGTTTAPYYGSLSQTFRYKQFSLYAIGMYSFGSVFRRPTISTYTSTRQAYVFYDLNKDIDLRWRNPGDELTTQVPGIAGSFAPTSLFRYANSDINILDGSYIRLREVSLGYDLPASVANKIAARNINFSLAVRNPGLLWTKNKEGIDPDFIPYLNSNTLGLPPSASYTMTINIGF